MSEDAGEHVWYDLMTTDTAGATDFYTSVVGWGTQPFEGAPEPYDMWTVGDRPVGGMVQMPPDVQSQGVPPHWLAYIATPDADATAARAVELGGSHLHTQEVPTVGRFAILRDPFGAVFAAFTPEASGPPREGRPSPGEFSWHELMTDDQDRAFDFYSALFGWTKGTPMDMGPMGTYQIVQTGGSDFGGLMDRPAHMPMSAWLYYVNVADIDAALERVKAGGGRVLNGPMVVPGGDRVAQCSDPQGGAFALHVFAEV